MLNEAVEIMDGKTTHYVITTGWDGNKKKLLYRGFSSSGDSFSGHWDKFSDGKWTGHASGIWNNVKWESPTINEFKKAKDLEPNYALAYWALGNIYEAKYNYIGDRNNPEDLKQMQDYYAQAYERNSEIGETNLGLGWSFYNQEKIDSAFHWFKRALELDPNNPIVNKDVGAFLRSIGLYEQAIHFFSKALNSNPLYLSPRIQIAACQMCVGKFKKASRQFKRILKKDPDNLTALDLYASQLVMMNKTHKAEGQIKKALSILGNDPRAILTSQLLLWAAKGEKDRVLSSIPEDQKISIDTTYAYLLLGMKDKAIQNIQEGIDRK